MQHEPQNPGEDPREDPTNGMSEEADTSEETLNLVSIIQQNAVIITGREAKGGQPEPDESNSERWL